MSTKPDESFPYLTESFHLYFLSLFKTSGAEQYTKIAAEYFQ